MHSRYNSVMARDAKLYDVTVIGGGIVGLGTAMALALRGGVTVAVVEAEDRLATHQTGRNSGVIHSGLYYKPGSLKAQLCVSGREALYRFCAEHDVPHERCGKVVVAVRPEEMQHLQDLESRGRANGLTSIRRLSGPEIRDLEPHAWGVAGLHVPDTGIVDYVRVAEAYAEEVRRHGGVIHTGARVRHVSRYHGELTVETTWDAVRTRYLVNCAGLQADRVARMCGVHPGLRIVPFRGEYYELTAERRELVRNLIYPVPDPQFPFLGVHFTRMIDGGVEAGPNAVLAFKREGYERWSFSTRDLLETMTYRGFWPMAGRYWRMGLGEFYRSFSKRAFVRALQALVPEIRAEDLEPAAAGVRAQAVEPDGRLVDDFRILEAERMVHVLNAPSPAATASITIGRYIADVAAKSFALGGTHGAR